MLIREGRRRRSPALVADGRHLMTDVVTSAGVIVGLMLVTRRIARPRSVLAALVAVNILWPGWKLVRESVGGLMDEAVPAERWRGSRPSSPMPRARWRRTTCAPGSRPADIHRFPPRRARAISVRRRTRTASVEQAMKAEVEDALITIHVEPEDKAKHAGIVVL